MILTYGWGYLHAGTATIKYSGFQWNIGSNCGCTGWRVAVWCWLQWMAPPDIVLCNCWSRVSGARVRGLLRCYLPSMPSWLLRRYIISSSGCRMERNILLTSGIVYFTPRNARGVFASRVDTSNVQRLLVAITTLHLSCQRPGTMIAHEYRIHNTCWLRFTDNNWERLSNYTYSEIEQKVRYDSSYCYVVNRYRYSGKGNEPLSSSWLQIRMKYLD